MDHFFTKKKEQLEGSKTQITNLPFHVDGVKVSVRRS